MTTKARACVKTKKIKRKSHLSHYDPLPVCVKKLNIISVATLAPDSPCSDVDSCSHKRTITKEARSVKLQFNTIIARETPKQFANVCTLFPSAKTALLHPKQTLRLACYSKYPKLKAKCKLSDPPSNESDAPNGRVIIPCKNSLLKSTSCQEEPDEHISASAVGGNQINSYYPSVRRPYDDQVTPGQLCGNKAFDVQRPSPGGVTRNQDGRIYDYGDSQVNRDSKIEVLNNDCPIPSRSGDTLVEKVNIFRGTSSANAVQPDELDDDGARTPAKRNTDEVPQTTPVTNTEIGRRLSNLADRMTQVQDWLAAHECGVICGRSERLLEQKKHDPKLPIKSPEVGFGIREDSRAPPIATPVVNCNDVQLNAQTIRRKLINNDYSRAAVEKSPAVAAPCQLSPGKPQHLSHLVRTSVPQSNMENKAAADHCNAFLADSTDEPVVDNIATESRNIFFSSTPRMSDFKFGGLNVKYCSVAGQNLFSDPSGQMDVTPIAIDKSYCANLNRTIVENIELVDDGCNLKCMDQLLNQDANALRPGVTRSTKNSVEGNVDSMVIRERRRKMLTLLFGLLDSSCSGSEIVSDGNTCLNKPSNARRLQDYYRVSKGCTCPNCLLCPSSPDSLAGMTNLKRRMMRQDGLKIN